MLKLEWASLSQALSVKVRPSSFQQPPSYRTTWCSMESRGHGCLWVVVKIMVPFWIPIIIRHLIFRDPKRDHNFDNHPYSGSPVLGFGFGV